MIEQRKALIDNPYGSRKEYYLESMGKWYSAEKLAEIEGCEVMTESIKGRIRNKSRNPEFDTLDGCVYTPKKMGNGMSRGELSKAKDRREAELIDMEHNRWMQLNKVWPVLKSPICSALIMQSKAIR